MADPISTIAMGIGGISNIAANALNYNQSKENLAFQKYQYEDMKRYNSASEQVRRLRAAGINPALMYGQDAGAASAVSSPAPIPQQPLDMNGLSAMANSVVLNDAEKDKTKSEIDINHLKAFNQELQNTLDSVFARAERTKGLEYTENKIKSEFNRSLLLAAQGDYTKALEQLSKAQEFVAYAQGGKLHQEMLNLQEEFKWISVKARSYINHLSHQNRALDASSSLNELDYDIKSEPSVRNALGQTFIATLDKLKSDKKVSDETARRVSHLADIAEKDNDSYYWVLVYEELLKGGATFAELMTLRKKISALQGLSDAAGTNAQTRSKRLEHDVDLDNNTYEHVDTYEYKNGQYKPKTRTKSGRVRRGRR